ARIVATLPGQTSATPVLQIHAAFIRRRRPITPAHARRDLRRLSARRRSVRYRRPSDRRQGPRLQIVDRRASRRRARARHVDTPDDRKRLSDSRHRSPDRRDAVSRRLRSDYTGVRQAGRREPAARLSADAAGSDGRRPGLQPSDRAVVARTDRGDPDVRRSAPRNRRRRAAVPARSLPCAGNDDRDRAALLPALVSRRGVARPQGAELKVHEYQGKEILRRFGIPTPRGIPAFSVDEAVKAAEALGGAVWVVKAQIHAGGRGKGGGVKLAKSIDAVRELAGQILGMQLITHQTG